MRNLISKCWLKTSRWHKNSRRCRSADLFRACGENQNPPLGLVFPRDVERASGRRGNPAWGNPALWPLPSAAAHTWVATSWVFWRPGLLKIVPASKLLCFPKRRTAFLCGSAGFARLKCHGSASWGLGTWVLVLIQSLTISWVAFDRFLNLSVTHFPMCTLRIALTYVSFWSVLRPADQEMLFKLVLPLGTRSETKLWVLLL